MLLFLFSNYLTKSFEAWLKRKLIAQFIFFKLRWFKSSLDLAYLIVDKLKLLRNISICESCKSKRNLESFKLAGYF
ncbi:MAG: hypothetical protein CL674_04640 [Bdellovibrionaceae bacterium]|nr:hypothetical protein [Pseudobdellovibrionaceae bacterium]